MLDHHHLPLYPSSSLVLSNNIPPLKKRPIFLQFLFVQNIELTHATSAFVSALAVVQS